MNELTKTANGVELRKPSALPPFDWIVLPIIGMLTVCLTAGLMESLSRRLFPKSDGRPSLPHCEVHNDSPAGARAMPNSTCWEKLPEGELTKYDFNSCGDRETIECRSGHPGKYRIVMIGTSTAEGRYLPEQQTIASYLPGAIAERKLHPVELYNSSMMQGFLESVRVRSKDVQANNPNMVLWIVTPHDLEESRYMPNADSTRLLPWNAGGPRSLRRVWYLLTIAFANNSIQDAARVHFDRTETALALRHYLYESPSLYVKSSLMQSDADAGFLKVSMSDTWQEHLRQFDRSAAENQAWAMALGVPLVVALVPNRVQASMISEGEWPEGTDPYALDKHLRRIVTGHGGIYIDILSAYCDIPNPQRLYFPVDGHPNSAGSLVIANAIAAGLASNGPTKLGWAIADSAPQN